jgi:hypothetical protein
LSVIVVSRRRHETDPFAKAFSDRAEIGARHVVDFVDRWLPGRRLYANLGHLQ